MNNQRAIAAIALSAMSMAWSPGAVAQDEEQAVEEVVVTGIRSSLRNAVDQKRNSDKLVEVIIAEDIGKLPDQNLAEVLENITGIQITRTAGVGTNVQIRGTDANRVEINGVSTVGSGAGRSGIDFEDVNASIISAVEVVKSPDAKTIEGSVGGTVNLKTIRPLQLSEMLGSVRLQFEDSSLSTESMTPRISGAYGDNWSTDAGDFGFVISGSYTEQEAVSFRPRADRDNRASPPGANPSEFLGMQFLLQEQENDDYETTNIATTLEWAPNDEIKLHFDAVINDQERSRDQYRLQASGISALSGVSIPTAFETVDFGVGPGMFPAALRGTLEPDLTVDDDDPNLRFTSETGSRVTESGIYALGGEWRFNDRWMASAQISHTISETLSPTLNTTLNFINPNCPLDGTSNDNCVPFVYDLSGGTLSFGINFDSPFAPDVADLTNPANVVLDQVQVGRNVQDNKEDAFRLDFTYDLDNYGVTTVEFGYRYNESTSRFYDVGDNIGGFSRMVDSPNGLLFEELLVTGPSNYGDGDGRDLFIANFLLVDPDRAFSDPEGVINILQDAVIAHDPASPDILNVRSDPNQFYDIAEETNALYAQASFESGIFRGNVGVRYVETTLDSTGFGPADAGGSRSLETQTGDYSFLLPRLNLIAQPTDEVLIRFGFGKDIRRPEFDRVSTGFEFDPSENAVVELGNPGLRPEEVASFDLSVEWYFAPGAMASIGYFEKDRTDIFGELFDGAEIREGPTDEGFVTTNGLSRETNPPCAGGGIYNPIVVPNQLGDPDRLGMCVDFTRPTNDPAVTTQSGIELAVQYDLAEFENRLGWASGFGFLFNYTKQDFSGGSIEDCTSGRGAQVLGDNICQPRGLLDFSEDAYNFTVFYEKYGLSARTRYTWRDTFRTQDFAGGANTSGSSTFSFPVNTLDRGQLNASISYAVNDNLDIGLEAVNLTEEEIYQHCVAETGPLCFVGLPDRRITIGASYRF